MQSEIRLGQKRLFLFDTSRFRICVIQIQTSKAMFLSPSGPREVTVRRNACPRCPSTSPQGPWRLLGQWENTGVPMALPSLLDGRHPPWCSCGCIGCCYGCHGPLKLNKQAAVDRAGRRSKVLFPPHLPPPHPLPAPLRGGSTPDRVVGSWTGCCRKRDPSTDVQSTLSSERGSSRAFPPDTRFTGECCPKMDARGWFVCLCPNERASLGKKKKD